VYWRRTGHDGAWFYLKKDMMSMSTAITLLLLALHTSLALFWISTRHNKNLFTDVGHYYSHTHHRHEWSNKLCSSNKVLQQPRCSQSSLVIQEGADSGADVLNAWQHTAESTCALYRIEWFMYRNAKCQSYFYLPNEECKPQRHVCCHVHMPMPNK